MNRLKEKCIELIYHLEGGMIRDRNQCAGRYAEIIAMSYLTADTEIGDVNQRIIDTWSFSGLKYIKDKAWKIYESNQHQELKRIK